MGEFERLSEYYDLIYQRMVDYDRECDILEKIFAEHSRETVRSILDVGCGTGSHALILSKRGYGVTGIDISKAMIEKANMKAEREKVEVEFFVQDLRNMNLDREFDCAICMFGGFGYILRSEGLAGLFSGLKRHLIEDGLFVFEFWSVGGLKPTPYKSWTKIQNQALTLYRLSESNFDHQTHILNIDMHFIVIRNDRLAEEFTETHRIRCYTLPEMQQHLNKNGFELLFAYDWDSKETVELMVPKKETFRILVISRKQRETHKE